MSLISSRTTTTMYSNYTYRIKLLKDRTARKGRKYSIDLSLLLSISLSLYSFYQERHRPLDDLLSAYGKRCNLQPSIYVFSSGGDILPSQCTPHDLDVNDGDVLDIIVDETLLRDLPKGVFIARLSLSLSFFYLYRRRRRRFR